MRDQCEDLLACYAAAEADWGCQTPPTRISTEPQRQVLAFRNWLVGTTAGSAVLDVVSVARFAADLKPRMLPLAGDVGMPDMHDGTSFTPGAETSFLSNLAVPHTYDRRAASEADGGEKESARQRRHIAIVAGVLAHGDEGAIPRVRQASLDDDGHEIRARVSIAPEPEALRLWWNHSENRPFNDPGQAIWQSAPMVRDGAQWVSPAIAPPAGEAIAWYVEAEQTVPRRDATRCARRGPTEAHRSCRRGPRGSSTLQRRSLRGRCASSPAPRGRLQLEGGLVGEEALGDGRALAEAGLGDGHEDAVPVKPAQVSRLPSRY
jgi:hypothetical protein